MPDLERAVKGRRQKLAAIWSSKEWKEKKGAFLEKNPLCAMHLTAGIEEKAVVPHHPYTESYKGHYTDLELSGCVAYCQRCHFAVHHGLALCKVCGEHYHRWDADMCRACFEEKNPEIVKAQKEYAEERKTSIKERNKEKAKAARASKVKHPCTNLTVSGKCKLSKIDTRCTYSAKKALTDCVDFVPKGNA